MNFNEFASSLRSPEGTLPWGAATVQGSAGEVLLAGTVLTATKELCLIDINGAQYEIAPSDVIDIEIVNPTPTVVSKGSADKADKKGSAAEEEIDVPEGPHFVLLKVHRNTILRHRAPVQAAVVAAMGTWVSVVPPPAKAAEQQEAVQG